MLIVSNDFDDDGDGGCVCNNCHRCCYSTIYIGPIQSSPTISSRRRCETDSRTVNNTYRDSILVWRSPIGWKIVSRCSIDLVYLPNETLWRWAPKMLTCGYKRYCSSILLCNWLEQLEYTSPLCLDFLLLLYLFFCVVAIRK